MGSHLNIPSKGTPDLSLLVGKRVWVQWPQSPSRHLMESATLSCAPQSPYSIYPAHSYLIPSGRHSPSIKKPCRNKKSREKKERKKERNHAEVNGGSRRKDGHPRTSREAALGQEAPAHHEGRTWAKPVLWHLVRPLPTLPGGPRSMVGCQAPGETRQEVEGKQKDKYRREHRVKEPRD